MGNLKKAVQKYSPKLKLISAEASVGGFSGGAYNGASDRPAMRRWGVSSGDADSDLNDALPLLRDRGQSLYRNTSTARAVIKRKVNGTVGAGLGLRSTIDGKYLGLDLKATRKWNDDAERLYRWWGASLECDYTRQMTMGEIQELVSISQMLRGDAFALLPYNDRTNIPFSLCVQLIEADRVSNPDDADDTDAIRAGIERDGKGIPVAIHVRNIHPGNEYSRKMPEWKRIPIFGSKSGRRNVLHLMEFERIDQSRGEPLLAPIIEPLKQLTKYSEAELSAAVVNAILTVFVKRATEADGFDGKGQKYSTEQRERWEESPLELGSGTWIEGAPGEELQTVTANRPSAQFDTFYNACVKQIGMGVGLPFEVLIQHYSSSYSASRAALLDAYKSFKIDREKLRAKFCQPIYEEFITEAVLRGYLHAPGFLEDPIIRSAYCRAQWMGPNMGQIDPLKEATAAKMRADNILSTHGHETAEHTGMDFEQVAQTLAEERDLLRELGLVPGGLDPVAAQKLLEEEKD